MALVLLAVSLALPCAFAEEKDKDKDKQPLDTEAFVKKAGEINYAEIAMGQLALQKAARPDVKQYAMKLVQDHTKSNQEMLQLAAKNKWVLAGSADAKHQALAQKMAQLQPAEFDKEFIHHMVMGHKEAIRMFEAQSKNAKNADAKSFAEMQLPVLREHLKMAEKLHGDAKKE